MVLAFLLIAAQVAAATAPSSAMAPAVSSPTGNSFVVLVRLAFGLGCGFVITIMLRRRFREWYANVPFFQHAAFIADKLLVLTVGILTGVFELWKRPSFETEDRFLLTIYLLVGLLSALGIGIPWLVTISKDDDKMRIKDLMAQASQAIQQRDASVEAVAAIGAVVDSKKKRLAEVVAAKGNIPIAALPDALGPKVQVFMLMKSLHQHFARHVPAPGRLRVGIYMRSPENAQTLAPLYSWDGSHENCFSNSHPGYMSLDAPGGAQSLVVQCFRSESPLLLVADCVRAAEQNKFIFFSPAQRDKIKSMVAYRYNLHHSPKPDALILTMDTDHAGFFSANREFECQLLLQETGSRLELELIALELIKKLPSA